MATIVSVNGDRLTVRASDGDTEYVTVNSSTRISKTVSGSVSDLKAGETIGVSGTTPVSSTTGNAVPATGIVIQPANGS